MEVTPAQHVHYNQESPFRIYHVPSPFLTFERGGDA